MIKEKIYGRIKGRTVADRKNQRNMYSKEETSSPMVSNDAFMLSLITIIDAMEGRDVATADIQGAYLQAKRIDFTLLLEGWKETQWTSCM